MSDDFDDAIRSRLQQPAPTSSGSAQAVLDELRPAMRRARIKRSLAIGTATLSLLGLVGLGALAVTDSITQDPTELQFLIEGDSLPDVTPAPSTKQPEQDDPLNDAETDDIVTATTPTTTPISTRQAPPTTAITTTAPEPTAPTTHEPQATPQPPTPPPSTTTQGATVPATTNPPITTSSTAPPTTATPASAQQTIQSNCGSIIVNWTGGNISLTGTRPAAGFSPEIENSGPQEVKVKFDNGDAECAIKAKIESGTLRTDVDDDDGDD